MINCGHCKGVHENVNGVWLCAQMDYQAQADAEAEAAILAHEQFLDWQDAQVDAQGDGSDFCEHGLSAWLCDGPQHYPFDQDELDCVA